MDKEITGETERLRSEEDSTALTELDVISPKIAIDNTVIARRLVAEAIQT
jgi:hypothetical protein